MSTPTPPGIGLSRLLDYPLARFPDKLAYIDDREAITFAELELRAARLARAFSQAGATAGDRVALILPNSIAFIVVEIAILRSGLVKVPLNFRFHPKEVLYSLADCEPSILVCDASLADAVTAKRADLPSLREIVVVSGERPDCLSYRSIVAQGDGPAPDVPYGADDPVLIRYTGGTTGKPKGIVHTSASFLAINLDVIRELALQADDVVLHLGHLSHGLNFMWAAIQSVGITQILRESFTPKQVLRDFETHRVTIVYMVPTMVQRMLREDDGAADTSSLRMVMYSSAPMPVPVLREAIARYGNIFTQVYTLSEAPVITTIMHAAEHIDRMTAVGHRLASCGREVVTMEIRLLDDDMKDVARGEVGEIAVRSINNMAAYWRLPEETAATLVEGWLRTGDLAVRDEDGYLHIVDRKKDVIITGAFNVYPSEVETVLYQHPAIAQAAVVGVPHEEWGETIKAVIVLKPGQSVTREELVALCRDNLADYKKPRLIEFVDELPLSPVGKIMRRALRHDE